MEVEEKSRWRWCSVLRKPNCAGWQPRCLALAAQVWARTALLPCFGILPSLLCHLQLTGPRGPVLSGESPRHLSTLHRIPPWPRWRLPACRPLSWGGGERQPMHGVTPPSAGRQSCDFYDCSQELCLLCSRPPLLPPERPSLAGLQLLPAVLRARFWGAMTEVKREVFGQMPQEERGGMVEKFILKSDSVKVEILSLGCIIAALEMKGRDGECSDVVLGFDTLEGESKSVYLKKKKKIKKSGNLTRVLWFIATLHDLLLNIFSK